MDRRFLESGEFTSISFMTLAALVILSATNASFMTTCAFLAGQCLVFAGAIVMHELAHMFVALRAGATVTLSWLPHPEVLCTDLSVRAGRLVAIAGPLSGAVVCVAGLSLLVALLQVSVLLYMTAITLAGAHIIMLLPIFADGKALFSKKEMIYEQE